MSAAEPGSGTGPVTAPGVDGASAPEIGLCLAAFADRSFDDALAETAALGLTTVDLPTDSMFAISATRPTDPGAVAARLADAGIRVGCVSNSRDAQLVLGPHGPLTDPVHAGTPSDKVDHGTRAAADAIELAAAVGAPLVRLLLGCPDYGRWLRWSGSGAGWDDNVAAFVEAAVPLAGRARALGVRLCIEPHVKQVAFDAPSILACVQGVAAAGESIGVCLDPANLVAIGHDPIAVLDAIAQVPSCVHAKDVERSSAALVPPGAGWVRYGPQPAIRFRAVPWGELAWPAILTALHERGFRGPIFVEHEDVLVDRARGIAAARDHLEAHRLGGPPASPWW